MQEGNLLSIYKYFKICKIQFQMFKLNYFINQVEKIYIAYYTLFLLK